jgi:hypothetical protein
MKQNEPKMILLIEFIHDCRPPGDILFRKRNSPESSAGNVMSFLATNRKSLTL